jgi:hypothetical protein
MSETPLSWPEVRRAVHARAHGYCEYCQTNGLVIGQAMHIEHITPNGDNALDNLCLACANCNLSKGVATHMFDPLSEQYVALFNPRTQVWAEHFRWVERGARLEGVTPVGRATVERLKMNQDRVLAARARWVQAGWHPPTIPKG